MSNFARWWWGFLAVSLACVVGCTGGVRIEIVSLDYSTIDPPAPRVTRIDMQECYWWTDEDGRVWIAMQRQQTPLLQPRLAFRFQLSLVLEKLPAGRARNYAVAKKELRARARFGPWESRFTSRAGIIAMYRESNDRLRGSFRLEAARVVSRWLGGWSRPTRYLILGSFVAVHDEQRGRAIAEATESSGWGRDAPAQRSPGRAPARSASRPFPAPTTAPTRP